MKKKYLLSVQGEGRGHVTQAMTLYELLVANGHEVCAIILGSSGKRDIPTFFINKVKAPIIQLQSPNFVTDKKNKSINVTKSVIHGFRNLKTYRASLKKIDDIVKKEKPDVIINFFDLLVGLYYRFYKPNIPHLCIAHQYIYLHPQFEFPKGKKGDQLAIKFFTKVTSIGSKKKLALSFYDIPEIKNHVTVVPPLLRDDVFTLRSELKDHFLIYLVNNGYFDEIAAWHKLNPTIELHCFTDNPDYIKSNYVYDQNTLFVHAINDKLFLEKMSEAKGLATSAGFESVCEAMYLGKPVLMVPIKGHYEQFCNSRDGHKAGAGVYADSFELTKLLNYQAGYENKTFKNWVRNAKERIYSEIVSF